VTPREFAQRGFDTRQEFAMTVKKPRADAFDFDPHRSVMMRRQEFDHHPLQGSHIRAAAVTNIRDYAELVPAQRTADLGMICHCDAAEDLYEGSLRFKEMNVRIPQRVVSVEDQVQAARTRI
jgi:hypothetical protein